VTARRAIPNSLDGEEHAAFRAVIDRYLTPARVAILEPAAGAIAARIVGALPRGSTVKTITQIGMPFAVRVQSAWLGWSRELEPTLVAWVGENRLATRSGDRSRTAAVAEEFDQIVHALVEARRGQPIADVTGELMRESVEGRPLDHYEVVSILRNWTAGDLGSLATSVGVVVHFLATRPEAQAVLRAQAEAGDHLALEAAIEEILRIDDPFVSNRRRATRAVDLGGRRIERDEGVLLNWTAANRDPQVFDDPDRFDPVGNAQANLVFGIGPHLCPGRALTLMELRVVTLALLAGTEHIELSTERPAVRETRPTGGWARVPVVLR
jgi:cytochrome P450